jgi:hypothetical protein
MFLVRQFGGVCYLMAHIRVVDELPDVLFFKLNNEQRMRLESARGDLGASLTSVVPS